MWCPPDFRRVQSQSRRKQKIDAEIYDAQWVEQVNVGKQTLKSGHFGLV
jgi:hypothetical protein